MKVIYITLNYKGTTDVVFLGTDGNRKHTNSLRLVLGSCFVVFSCTLVADAHIPSDRHSLDSLLTYYANCMTQLLCVSEVVWCWYIWLTI